MPVCFETVLRKRRPTTYFWPTVKLCSYGIVLGRPGQPHPPRDESECLKTDISKVAPRPSKDITRIVGVSNLTLSTCFHGRTENVFRRRGLKPFFE